MTERKPLGMTFESWIDRQIRVAHERGDFDDLDGAGQPLPGAGQPLEQQWWVKGYLDREGLTGEALLPTPLQLRKEIERLPETVQELPTERAVREAVSDLNRRIVEWLRSPSGPRVPLSTIRVDDVVESWRGEDPAPPAPATEPAPARPMSRWRRFTRLLSGKR